MRRYKNALVALVLMIGWCTLSFAEGTKLLLDVIVNGHSIDLIGLFEERADGLYVHTDEAESLGLRVRHKVDVGVDGFVNLKYVSGLTYQLNASTQTINIEALDDRLEPIIVRLAPFVQPKPSSQTLIESGTGIGLNYNFSESSSQGLYYGGGSFDLRFFSPLGVISNTALGYFGASAVDRSWIRLDTTYVYADPDRLKRISVGDFISSSPDWGRSVRLGGIQLSSDFGLRPDLITFPVPMMGASARVPSTLDVLVNGSHLLSQAVQPGPFRLSNIPIVSGAGSVQMNMTDVAGNRQQITLPFYASKQLLAPDLQTYSLDLGSIRRNWGIQSSDYTSSAGAMTYRRGLTNNLTVDMHAEGARDLSLVGAGASMNLANLAVGSLSLSDSKGVNGQGKQIALNIQRLSRSLSAGLAVSRTQDNYDDIAALNGDVVPRRQMMINLGYSLANMSSIGAVYAQSFRDRLPPALQLISAPGGSPLGEAGVTSFSTTFQPVQRSSLLTLTYSVQISGLGVFLTGFKDFDNKSSSGVVAGATIPLDARSYGFVSSGKAAGSPFQQVQVARTASDVGSWGYRVTATHANENAGAAETEYRAPWALLSTGVGQYNNVTTLRAAATGSVAYMGGRLYASNLIGDSFAVVDTGGLKGVRVMSENRVVGKTDSTGCLLVPNLLSLENNRISLEPTDVPLDIQIPEVDCSVRPRYRSGVIVHFPMKKTSSALIQIVDSEGVPVPLGSTATLMDTKATVPIGYDGEAFLEALAPRNNRLMIRTPNSGGACFVEFDYEATPGEVTRIGPLQCRESLQ